MEYLSTDEYIKCDDVDPVKKCTVLEWNDYRKVKPEKDGDYFVVRHESNNIDACYFEDGEFQTIFIIDYWAEIPDFPRDKFE